MYAISFYPYGKAGNALQSAGALCETAKTAARCFVGLGMDRGWR